MWAPHGLASLPSLGEPQAVLPWQRQDVGERSLVPAPPVPLPTAAVPCILAPSSCQPCLAICLPVPSLYPGSGQRPCPGRFGDLSSPPYLSQWPEAFALMPTHVWPELLLFHAPRGEPSSQSVTLGTCPVLAGPAPCNVTGG